MSEKRASLEVIAPSVEEAVARGLEDLALSAEAVDVEVLDPGSRGLFGLGSRQARVRLTIKAQPETAAMVEMEPEVEAEDLQIMAYPPAVEVDEPEPEPERQPVPIRAREPQGAPAPAPVPAAPSAEPRGDADDAAALRVARETVTELLQKMKVRATVTSRLGDADEPHSKPPVWVDVNGNDLSILIGPRAETLNALQYIAGLIVSKELGRSVPLVVDVQGFRARREQQIRQLARRMADQAVKTGKRQVLEPMPANERRLVHIELRSNAQVTTESVGEDPRRKVTIIPK